MRIRRTYFYLPVYLDTLSTSAMILTLIVATAAGIFLNILAFSSNAGILWVVLKNKTLRKAPTSVFLLNLCINDLCMALLLIPVAITILISASFEENGILVPTYVCGPISFFHSLLVYSGAWAAAAISVDRRFSIVAPMTHAAFMTTRRALLAIFVVWTMAAIFAGLPHIFPSDNSNHLFNYTTSTSSTATAMFISLVSSSSYSSMAASFHSNSTALASNLANMSAAIYTNNSASSLYLMSVNSSKSISVYLESRQECHMWKTCALMFALDWSNTTHVLTVFVGCYLIPTFIMISMYLSIFKVARKAGLQVHPSNSVSIPTISNEVEARDEADKTEEEAEEDGQRGMSNETTETDERNGHSAAITAAADDAHNDRDATIGTDTGRVRDAFLEVESSRNCIFRQLFWNDKKADDIPPIDGLTGANGDTSRQFEAALKCPECSSKSCPARLRSGSEKSLEFDSTDTSGHKGISSSVVAGGKARRTLLIILGLSLASWTPYYLVHVYCACTNDCWRDLSVSKLQCPREHLQPNDRLQGLGYASASCNVSCTSVMFPVSFLVYRRSSMVSVVVWLLFISAAINPILYGLLNRPVREQVVLRASSSSAFCSHIFSRCFCRLCGKRGSPGGKDLNQGNEEADDGVEDFLQFLERTSSLSDTPTTRSSILQNEKI